MLLLKNGVLHTMEEDKPVRADLLACDGRILDIKEHINETSYMKVLDCSGRDIYPGFIEAHCHVGISEEKIGVQGDDCNEITNPVTPFLRAIDAINPMDSAFHNALAAGITSIMTGPGSANPIGGQFVFMKTAGRCIDDMVVLAPSAIKVAFGENPKMNYGENGNMPSTRMGTAAMIRKDLFYARQYLDNVKKDDRETRRFEYECYRELFDKKIPLKAHAHRTDDIFTALRIAREFDLDLTLDHCTEGYLIAEKIAESGFPAIVGPSLSSRSKNEVSLADFKAAGILKKAGVMVAITTDHPVSRIQYLPLSASLASKEGLGDENALRAITIDAARICRVDSRVGSIKIGKDADLVIFKGHPLDIASKLEMTIVNGQIEWNHLGN